MSGRLVFESGAGLGSRARRHLGHVQGRGRNEVSPEASGRRRDLQALGLFDARVRRRRERRTRGRQVFPPCVTNPPSDARVSKPALLRADRIILAIEKNFALRENG